MKTKRNRNNITLVDTTFVATDATATDAIVAIVGDEVITDPLQSIVDVSMVSGDTVIVTDSDTVIGHDGTLIDVPVTDAQVTDDTVTAPELTVAQHRSNLIIAVNTAIHNSGSTDAHWSQHRRTINNIWVPTRPTGEGATCWYFFDYMFAQGIIDTATLVTIGSTVYGLNMGQVRTEVSRYRKYHNIAYVGARKVTA